MAAPVLPVAQISAEVDTFPPAVRRKLVLDAIAIALVCATVDATAGQGSRAPDDAPDEPLTVPEAAARLGCSPSTLYERKDEPFFAALRLPTGTRRIRFSA